MRDSSTRRCVSDRSAVRSRILATCAVVALLTAGAPAIAAGQEPADTVRNFRSRVIGRVVDAETAAPVRQALLTLSPSNRRTLSDSTGGFLLLDVPPGTYQLEVQHIGYATRSVEVEILAARTTHLNVRLSSEPIALEPLTVEVQYRPQYLESRGFYDRMEKGIGSFFDPAWVERWSRGFIRGSDLVSVMSNFAPLFTSFTKTNQSSRVCAGGPTVYVDGRLDRHGLIRGLIDPDPSGGPNSRRIPGLSAAEIGAAELYPTAFGVPNFAYEFDPVCGVIVIWTKRWSEPARPREPRRIELCLPEFGEGRVTVEGQVFDAYTRVLLPGATVQAALREGEDGRLREIETLADRDGWYRFCDLPSDAAVSLTAVVAYRTGVGELMAAEGGPVLQHDLVVRISGPGKIVGRVLDRETGRPVSTAAVTVGGAHVTQSDAQGYFVLEEVTPGDHLLEVRHLGYEPLADSISILADRTVDVRAELSADPIALPPIVISTVRDRRLESRGFYERRLWGERLSRGRFFSREEIERRNPVQVSHLIGDVLGIRLDCTGSRGCRIGSTRSAQCDELSLYLDGVQIFRAGEGRGGPPLTIDELVRPSEVAAVEVYPGPSSLPAEFSGSTGQCGAVVIWTK